MYGLIGASQMRLYALTAHIIGIYEHGPLLLLWSDYMRSVLCRRQHMIYLMLVEAYRRDGIADPPIQYRLIDDYIHYHSDTLVRRFIMR